MAPVIKKFGLSFWFPASAWLLPDCFKHLGSDHAGKTFSLFLSLSLLCRAFSLPLQKVRFFPSICVTEE